MAIDKWGQWWVGSEPADIGDYLQQCCAASYQAQAFELCRCACGSQDFELVADDGRGAARRTCAACGEVKFIHRGLEPAELARPEHWRCIECHCDRANVGLGYALDAGDWQARWLYVGYRCCACGVLGCFAGWKVLHSEAVAQATDRISPGPEAAVVTGEAVQ